jgi:hypothetical protein
MVAGATRALGGRGLAAAPCSNKAGPTGAEPVEVASAGRLVPFDRLRVHRCQLGSAYVIMVTGWKGAGRPRVERWMSRLRRCGPG